MRNDWTFTYTNEKLLDAAQAKHEFHKKRLEWWNQKKADTLVKLKNEGIEIDGSLADVSEVKAGIAPASAFNYSNQYQRGVHVSLNDGLVRDIQECQQKIREHDIKMREYHGWIQVFSDTPPTHTQALDYNDWLYFFGKRTTLTA